MKNLSDTELLECLRNNPDNTACFNELYRRFAQLIFGAVYKSIPDEDICIDIAHDVLLKIKNGKHNINNLPSYIWQSTQNAITDKHRSRATEHHVTATENIDDLSEKNNKTFVTESAEDRLIDRENIKVILEKLKELPDIIRQCCEYRFEYGYSYKQIASTLNIEADTVRAHLQLARRHLKR